VDVSRENLEIFNAIFAAWKARDMETVLGLFDPNLELDFSATQFGDLIPRVGRGHDGALDVIRQWYDVWENHEEAVKELIDARENVVSVLTLSGRGKASGAQVELELYAVWTVREGKVVRLEGFATRADALEAAGALK
jgi:ketosteroid isomerase-like protein